MVSQESDGTTLVETEMKCVDGTRRDELQSVRIADQMLRLIKSLTLYTLAVGIALACFGVARAQQRPLITEDVDIIPPGSLRLEAGVDFMQNAKFPVSGLTGDLTRAGVIGINIGLAPNVEFQIEGVAQNVLSINSRSASAIPLNLKNANSTSDIGDFT